MRMSQLIASLARFALCCEQRIHRARRTEITSLIEQSSANSRRRAVDELLAVQNGARLGSFRFTQGSSLTVFSQRSSCWLRLFAVGVVCRCNDWRLTDIA